MGLQYFSELIFGERRLSDNEIKRIAFDKVKRRLGLNPKNTFIEHMRIVKRWNTPLGVVVVVEVEGEKWRYWTTV